MAYKEIEVNQISAGPWGGQYGCRWDDGVYCTVRQVVIASSAVIDSIRFEYDNKGLSVWSEKHGGGGGFKLDKIKLDCPNEYLVSISGHFGSVSELDSVVVRSLIFESNRKKYGPFGIQQGTSFSLPISGGKLVGFHGRSGWYLDSIGVYVKPLLQRAPITTPAAPAVIYANSEALNKGKVVTYGPWGGAGGMTFDDGIYTGVREITLTRTGGLVAIRVCYDLNSRAVWGVKNGRNGGLNKDKIVFDYPFELLTHITGYYASTILRGPTVVKSITFHTTKRSYGPFGDPQGIPFSSGSRDGVIVGFHGRKGYFIDSIGVHALEGRQLLSANPPNIPDPKTYEVVPLPVGRPAGPQGPRPWVEDEGNPMDPDPQGTGPWGGHGGKPRETGPWGRDGGKARGTGPQGPGLLGKDAGKARESGPCGLRPWGGDGGKPWDDGASYTGIRKIVLTRGEAICSIQVEYERNGKSVWSALHGHANNSCTYIISLDHPREMLMCVSGYYGFVSGHGGSSRVVRSLTFYTNVAKYGPYGEEIGTPFSSAAKMEGKVTGFHGRSGVYLDAIGVHMQQQQQQQQQWMGNESSYRVAVETEAIRAVLNKILV